MRELAGLYSKYGVCACISGKNIISALQHLGRFSVISQLWMQKSADKISFDPGDMGPSSAKSNAVGKSAKFAYRQTKK